VISAWMPKRSFHFRAAPSITFGTARCFRQI